MSEKERPRADRPPPELVRWQRADRIFERALGLSGEEREAFLRAAFEREPGLEEDVRALLEAATEEGDVLADHAADVRKALHEALESRHGDMLNRPSVVGPGDRFGPYRLVRLLGRGGMGAVFLAERADGAFERRVALKLIQDGYQAEDVVERFLAERQILASLDHPAIARMLDGGRTADGRPYLVMEYVEGRPVTEHCAAEGLGAKERLRLFCVVARAVQHAHQKLIVHRDLKPSNVLVTPDGRVKLLDFGIAKILEASGLPVRPPATAPGSSLLTPEYASPEQVRDGEVTTASDVYQLGLLLYEMLTGTSPYEPEGRSLGALERAICETRPSPPSKSTGPRGIRPRELRGDLDRIVMAALRKEPERRYTTAQQMAEDVERHIDGEPVRVRADKWSYRARKFLLRNRWPATAAAIAILALGSYTATLRVHARELATERDHAREEAAESRQIRDFLVSLFREANPARTGGREVSARELLDAGARRLERDLPDQPLVRAEMLSAVADVYEELGAVSRALESSEEAYEIRRRLLPAADPARVASLMQVARQRGLMGAKSADRTLETAVRIVGQARGDRDPWTARALANQALYADDLAPEVRRSLFETAIDILRFAPGDHRDELATVLVESAYQLSPENFGEAVARLGEALSLRVDVHGPEHPLVATTLSDLGLVVEARAPAASEVIMQRALDVHRETAGEGHTTTLTIANNLAGLYRDHGKYAKAEPLYRQVLAARRAGAFDSAAIAYPMYGLGRTLVEEGRGRDAEPYLRQVLAMGVFPDGDGRQVATRATLGWALAQQGRTVEARRELRAALETARRSPDAASLLPFVEARLAALPDGR